MKRFVAIVALAIPGSIWADRIDTHWHWPGWTVTTGEELFYGRIHTSYPATFLFDENPKTAWVFSGLTTEQKIAKEFVSRDMKVDSPYWLRVEPGSRVDVDGFELMNGYNKSDETFRKNRRVVELEVWTGDGFNPKYGSRLLKRVRLSDRSGWHRVRLPRGKYPGGIALRFTQFAGEPSADIALSGLRLLNRGRPVAMRMPAVVDFTEGSDCGCGTTWTATRVDGTRIIESDWSEGGSQPFYSPDGRYMAGVRMAEPKYLAWLLDTRSGRIVRRKWIPRSDTFEGDWVKGEFQLKTWRDNPVIAKLRP